MRKAAKVWLIAAAALVLLGGILFAVVMAALQWDFTKLSTVQYETNTYEIAETFRSISITTDTADIVFARSDDGRCRVECCEEEKAEHSVTVENDTLVIELADTRSWRDYIGFRLGSPKITVYLPDTEYDTLTVDENTGDIDIPGNIAFRNVDC